MSFDYEALHAQRQQTLVAFLTSELDLGPTFVRTASLSLSAGHMEHYAQAKQNAMNAAQTIRHFVDEVSDVVVRKEMESRLVELDRLISTL